MVQLRTPCLLLVRAATFLAHSQLLIVLGFKQVLQRVLYLTAVPTAVGVGFDAIHRIAFLKELRRCTTSSMECTEDCLPKEKIQLVESSASVAPGVSYSSDDMDGGVLDIVFEGLNQESVVYSDEVEDAALLPKTQSREEDSSARSAADKCSKAFSFTAAGSRTTVHLYIPHMDPSDLQEGALDRLTCKLEERILGLKVVGMTVRKGSLMVALDVIYTGTKPCDENIGSLLSQKVAPEVWFEWLELPWPQDGEEVMVQIGNSHVAGMRWDPNLQKWTSSSRVKGIPPCVRTTITQLEHQVLVPTRVSHSDNITSGSIDADYGRSDSSTTSGADSIRVEVVLKVSGPLSDSTNTVAEGTPLLRARYCGKAVPVRLQRVEEPAGLENRRNQPGDSASELCSGPLIYIGSSAKDLEGAERCKYQTLNQAAKSSGAVSSSAHHSWWRASIDLAAALCDKEVQPGIMMLEVWHGRLMSQSLPALVLPAYHMDIARELGSYCDQGASGEGSGAESGARGESIDLECNSIMVQLGMWMDYVHRKQALGSTHRNEELDSYMATSGCGLLELAIAKGWLFCSTMLIDGLLEVCKVAFRELAWGSNTSGNTLLHLAALSGKAYMVAAVIKWGTKNSSPWAWGVQNCDGVTPLHIVAAHPENTSLAASLLKHFESARVAWRKCKGGMGYTPKQINALLGFNPVPTSKKASVKASFVTAEGCLPPSENADAKPKVLSRFAGQASNQSTSMPLGVQDESLLAELAEAASNAELEAVSSRPEDKGIIITGKDEDEYMRKVRSANLMNLTPIESFVDPPFCKTSQGALEEAGDESGAEALLQTSTKELECRTEAGNPPDSLSQCQVSADGAVPEERTSVRKKSYLKLSFKASSPKSGTTIFASFIKMFSGTIFASSKEA